MTQNAFYPIGTAGQPWGPDEIAQWRATQVRQRAYAEVLAAIDALRGRFEVLDYGHIAYSGDQYPLRAVRNVWQAGLPCVLVTGGVHGYETSGVWGALRFLNQHAGAFTSRVNLLVAPCVSPWAYERIQRWNHDAVDPNRAFRAPSPAQESAALMNLVAQAKGAWGATFAAHIDLHETTDSDESEFHPALAARDGMPFESVTIPDGFYLLDDTENPRPEFQQAIIHAVQRVTHIAPADEQGQIFGHPMVAPGVIRYALKSLGLCASVTGARYTTTTEVYPDSPQGVTADQCNEAQAVAVCAAVEFLLG